MRHLLFSAAALAALGAGCCAMPPEDARVTFPHEATRVEGVCARAHVNDALAVSVEAPFKAGGQRRFRLRNAGATAHEILPEMVVMSSGRCDRAFQRSRKLKLEDAATCAPPRASTLAPDESVEMRLAPSRERFDDACTKVGLAVYTKVDGQTACSELGSWIVYHPEE